MNHILLTYTALLVLKEKHKTKNPIEVIFIKLKHIKKYVSCE